MKRIFTLLILSLIISSLNAQSPEKMTYQAVVRDVNNNLVSSSTIGMQISIIQSTTDGLSVYTETQTPTSNENGLVSIEIGTGTSSDDFSTIDWTDGPYFIKTETDPKGGTNYTIIGTNQLLSVPFALHAKTAETITGTITESDPIFAASAANTITFADKTNWDSKLDAEVDGSVTNELQAISIGNDTIYLSDGGFVKLPEGTSFSGSFNDLTDVPTGLADGDDDTNLDETQVDAYVANNGYLTSYAETDPIFAAHAANGITSTNVSNWNSAYGWGDHGTANYESAFSKNTAFNKDFGTTTGTVAQGDDSRITNGQTAYSWGDHAAANYEPEFSKNAAFNKTFGTTAGTVAQGSDSRIVNGQTAYAWGDHASEHYLRRLGGDAQGDIMYYNGTDWVRLTAGTSGQVLQTNGAGANPSWVAASFNDLSDVPAGLSDGDDNTQLNETQVDTYVADNGYLTSEVDGSITNEIELPTHTGNTGKYLRTDGSNPYWSSIDGTDIALGSDAQGDIMYYNGTNWVRLPTGTSGQVLQTNGANANPSWATASGGGSSNSAVVKTSDYTIQAGENVIISKATSTITFTLPTAAIAGSGAVLNFFGTTNGFNINTSDPIYDTNGDSQSSLSGKFILILASDGIDTWYQIK